MSHVLICIGGDGPDAMPEIQSDCAAVIAVDSGLSLADNLGLNADLIVGDMDSVNAELLASYENRGAYVSRFDREKDETDFELGLLAGQNYLANQLVVLGGGGGRLDHLLANLAVVSGPKTEQWVVDMHTSHEIISICRPGQPREIEAPAGTRISLIPVGGNALGVCTKGFKWELRDETLEAYAARGVSNEIGNFHPHGTAISIANGSVAIIRSV